MLVLNVLVLVLGAGMGAGYGYVQWRLGQIREVDLEEGVLVEERDEGPMNVLLVGSDSREGLRGDDATLFGVGRTGGRRSDTIMVLHVDPKKTKAALLSIPRDLWVTIADTGRRNRINTAFNRGPQNLIETIRLNLGIEIHHYVEIDFVGFRSLVDAIDGVEMRLRAPVRDLVTGLDIRQAGCATLDGAQALAWARSRHFQEKLRGTWRTDPTGDHGRIVRQQVFLRRVMSKASRRAANPLRLNELIGIGVDNLARDDAMSNGDITRLARRFRSLAPEAVDMLTVPTMGFRTSGGASALRLKQPDAQIVIDRLNGIEPPPTTTTTTTTLPPRATRTGVSTTTTRPRPTTTTTTSTTSTTVPVASAC